MTFATGSGICADIVSSKWAACDRHADVLTFYVSHADLTHVMHAYIIRHCEPDIT